MKLSISHILKVGEIRFLRIRFDESCSKLKGQIEREVHGDYYSKFHMSYIPNIVAIQKVKSIKYFFHKSACLGQLCFYHYGVLSLL